MLEQTIATIKRAVENRTLSDDEAKGFISIISTYAKRWAQLQDYDEQTLQEVIAISDPEQEKIIIPLIINMLVDEIQR